MLNELRFVKGAVGKKDLVPALTHFHIHEGRVTGYNGKMSLSAPIPLDIDCCPKAVPFVRAIEACGETAQLHVTPSGKLAIRSGKFRAHVDTLSDVGLFPDVRPEGEVVHVSSESPLLLPAMQTLLSICSDDASRPWATGVLLDGESAYATNNVVLAELWLGRHFPYRVNVPRYAVKEMLRIGEEPSSVQVSTTSITFHYPGDRWLRTQLNSIDWPDVHKLLNRMPAPDHVAPVPDGLWDALDTLEPFLDDANRVYMLGDRIATAAEEGASVELPGLPHAGIYNHAMLSLLNGIATKLGLEEYPQTVPWYGERVRGLLVGLRQQGEM